MSVRVYWCKGYRVLYVHFGDTYSRLRLIVGLWLHPRWWWRCSAVHWRNYTDQDWRLDVGPVQLWLTLEDKNDGQ